ncbi:MAG: 2-hydroxyacid dehydrogenase [Alphaproteobacteria bacterium]
MAEAILFASDIDDPAPWRDVLAKGFPELEFRVWPELGRPEEILYALIWKIQGGVLGTLPNLRAIFALGAGVDQILVDPAFPRHIPLARLVEAGLAEQMSEYAIFAALYFHRRMGEYFAQQSRREWNRLPTIHPAARTVGVMGLGNLGGDAARKLSAIGYRTIGWSRTEKHLPGVECFAGPERQADFLRQSEILINLLPLTDATRGILGRALFAQLPDGACIVHLGRGVHLVEQDLLDGLDTGKLGGAMLDVFPLEPLPKDHLFWSHPKIVVTPHISTQPIAELARRQVVENFRRIAAGQSLIGLVDPDVGY